MNIDWTKYPNLTPANIRIETYTPAVPRGREHQGTRVTDTASGLVARGSGYEALKFALSRLNKAAGEQSKRRPAGWC